MGNGVETMSQYKNTLKWLGVCIALAITGCGESEKSSTVLELGDNGGGEQIADGNNGDTGAPPVNTMTDAGASPAQDSGNGGQDNQGGGGPSIIDMGTSQPPQMTGGGGLGSACNADSDCETGLCVTGLPGGYCSNVCTSADDCGPNGSCWNLGQPQQLCLLNCAGDNECRTGEGYVCDGDNTCFPNGNGGGGNQGGGGGEVGMGVGPGAAVGEIIQDFSLTNCGTEQPQSMRAYFEGQRAGHMLLTAGWCPACRQFIPQVIGLMNNPQAAGLKVAFVLGEDQGYNQPSIRYCQQYANSLNIPLENMFIDHDGQDSFATTFAHLQPYVDAQGAFGLPFNALLDPATFEYVYADRAGGDINEALGRLLAQ